MANENLHDIKVDELDSSKKTPLRNILTLLALLFIILVISVVITKLILNTDKGASIENNTSLSSLTSSSDKNQTTNNTDNDENKDSSKEENSNTNSNQAATTQANTGTNSSSKDADSALNSKTPEKNISTPAISSALKVPLTTHEPKEMRVYKEPKKNNTAAKEVKETAKNESAKNETAKKSDSSKNHVSTTPKKQYADKVIVKRDSTKKEVAKNASSKKETSVKRTSSHVKNASFLGGKRIKTSHSYYIKVGTYRDPSSVLRKIKKNNYNYSLVKVENDKTLTRVLVGPFFSRNQANGQLAKVKANILTGAYVTKVK